MLKPPRWSEEGRPPGLHGSSSMSSHSSEEETQRSEEAKHRRLPLKSENEFPVSLWLRPRGPPKEMRRHWEEFSDLEGEGSAAGLELLDSSRCEIGGFGMVWWVYLPSEDVLGTRSGTVRILLQETALRKFLPENRQL